MSKTLDQKLNSFEKDRLALISKLKTPFRIRRIVLILGVVFAFIEPWSLIGFGILWLVIYVIEYNLRKRFSNRFQEEIVPGMMERLSPNFTFTPKAGLSKEDFEIFGLNLPNLLEIKSKNLIQGIRNDMHIRLSQAQCDFKSKNKKDNTETIITGFSGHMMRVTMDGLNEMEWYILPKNSLTRPHLFTAKQESLSDLAFEKKPTGHEAFDKLFSYWTLPGGSILSKNFTSFYLTLQDSLESKSKVNLGLAVKGKEVLLCIHWGADLFSFTLEKSISEEVRETLEELQMCLDLPDNLIKNLKK